MLKIENIEDKMLDKIFMGRKEELCKEKKKEDYLVEYEKLLAAIQNLPPHFHNTREGILEALENYQTKEQLIMAYDTEKFYKSGFCDGIRTILESIQKNNSK